jgi:hypothetical protein
MKKAIKGSTQQTAMPTYSFGMESTASLNLIDRKTKNPMMGIIENPNVIWISILAS